jgi:hypothetical protein
MWHVPGRKVGVASGQKGLGAFVWQLELVRDFAVWVKVAKGELLLQVYLLCRKGCDLCGTDCMWEHELRHVTLRGIQSQISMLD